MSVTRFHLCHSVRKCSVCCESQSICFFFFSFVRLCTFDCLGFHSISYFPHKLVTVLVCLTTVLVVFVQDFGKAWQVCRSNFCAVHRPAFWVRKLSRFFAKCWRGLQSIKNNRRLSMCLCCKAARLATTRPALVLRESRSLAALAWEMTRQTSGLSAERCQTICTLHAAWSSQPLKEEEGPISEAPALQELVARPPARSCSNWLSFSSLHLRPHKRNLGRPEAAGSL